MELLVVLAIMALLAAVAIPAISGLQERWRLQSVAQGLASDMRLARQVAITTGKCTRLEFRWEARDYRIFLPVEKKTVRFPAGIDYAMNNFQYQDGVYKLSLSNTGAPSRGGTVGLKNRRGAKLYVIITPATGRVRVSANPPKDKY